jgi:hypothetical protein
MSLKIKETDWVTFDYDMPETYPKEGDTYIVMLDKNFRGYSIYLQPIIASAFRYYKKGELEWHFDSDDTDTIHDGDKYLAVDWEKLKDQFIPVQYLDKKFFKEKSLWLNMRGNSDHWGNIWINHLLEWEEIEGIQKEIQSGNTNRSHYKYLLLEIEGYDYDN